MQTTVRHSFLLTKRFPLDCFANNSVTKRLWMDGQKPKSFCKVSSAAAAISLHNQIESFFQAWLILLLEKNKRKNQKKKNIRKKMRSEPK